MKTAVLFAKINPERSLIARTLHEAGYKVAAVSYAEPISENISVNGVVVLGGRDPDLDGWIARAELIVVSGSAARQEAVAPALARGIALRRSYGTHMPVNTIVSGNVLGQAATLRKEVCRFLNPAGKVYARRYAGFADGFAERVAWIPAPERTESGDTQDMSWTVDRNALKHPYPDIPRLALTPHPKEYAARRFYVLLTGEAVAAYAGFLKGFRTVSECMQDTLICRIAAGAMRESAAVLTGGNMTDELRAYVESSMRQLANPTATRKVETVCGNPMRKLSSRERLTYPAVRAWRMALPYEGLALGIAAALRYDNPFDPESTRMQGMTATATIRIAAAAITGIDAGSGLMDAVVSSYHSIPYLTGHAAETATELVEG